MQSLLSDVARKRATPVADCFFRCTHKKGAAAARAVSLGACHLFTLGSARVGVTTADRAASDDAACIAFIFSSAGRSLAGRLGKKVVESLTQCPCRTAAERVHYCVRGREFSRRPVTTNCSFVRRVRGGGGCVCSADNRGALFKFDMHVGTRQRPVLDIW